MLRRLTNITTECMASPQIASVWSSNLERYVCEHSDEGRTITRRRQEQAPGPPTQLPPTCPVLPLLLA